MMSPQAPESSENESVAGSRWYHSIELPDGTVTPGEYDLRSISGSFPWPTRLNEMRCLDIGSRDGFYAFEMERRGAKTVISVDLDEPGLIDFPGSRPDPAWIAKVLEDGNRAFGLAHEALGSRVERCFVSAYELHRSELGRFDFAVLGTLLLHLRDPVSALRSARAVLDGPLLLVEPVTPGVDVIRRRAVAELVMPPSRPYWWLVNPAGLVKLGEAAGFRVIKRSRPFLIPYGPGVPYAGAARRLSRLKVGDFTRWLIQRRGVLHCWALLVPDAANKT